MSDTRELDDIIAGTEPTGEPEQETAPEPVKEEAPPAEAAPPAAEKSEPEAKDKPPPGFVPHQALAEERRKRQEYERRLAEFEKQQAEAKPKPNLFEDPEQWEKALEERTRSLVADAEAKAEARYLAMVEAAARSRYTDFDQYVQVFAEAARETPALIHEARAAADPADFAYQTGKRLSLVKEAGSLEELIRQAEARGEERARQSLQAKPKPEIPESLTDIAGGGDKAARIGPPPSLSELVPSI